MPRYKVTVEVMTEADNQLEAVDIAGEYLSGNFSTGVVMTCRVREVRFPEFLSREGISHRGLPARTVSDILCPVALS